MAEQQENNSTFRVHLKGYEAVILYPALVTPALVEPPDGCLTVILAVKDDFRDEYRLTKGAIGDRAARTLHSQLCLVTWGNAAIFDTSDVQYEGGYRQVVAQRHMLYASHTKAVEEYKAQNYQGWYLGELQKQDFPVEGFDTEGKSRKWGVIHQAAAGMYLAKGREYKHLIQLNFRNFDKARTNAFGMYELAFVYFKLYDDDEDLTKMTQGAGPIQEHPPMRCCYTDPDDDVLNDHFGKDDIQQKPELLRKPEEIKAWKIVGNDKIFKLYDDRRRGVKVNRPHPRPPGSRNVYPIDYVSKDHGIFLQSRHPVYIPEKWEGKVGVVGDLHVSSRQCLYPLANAQVIPTAEEQYSPYLGEIAHQNLSSAKSLMYNVSRESDILVIVGDMYDHSRNCDPHTFINTVNNTDKLWNALNYDLNQSYDSYPREIDGLLMLSQILSVYGSYAKPVIYTSGNHEAYEHPFGITPRVPFTKDMEFQIRINTGLAAEHNLTFYEAALLHGPGSYNIGTEMNVDKIRSDIKFIKNASELAEKLKLISPRVNSILDKATDYADDILDNVKDTSFDTSNDHSSERLKGNFRAKNFDWLYCLYTPWKDFVISYGAGESCYNFISLGWGNEEDGLIESLASGCGTLPRASDACTQHQVDLTKWAADSGAKYNILLTHFTFICYDREKALKDLQANINIPPHYEPQDAYMAYMNLSPFVVKTQYDIGSFYQNRMDMYKLLMSKNIHYSICGHSHRAGAYAFVGAGNGDTKTLGKLYSSRSKRDTLKPLGEYKVLVCGASGPYSHQNYNGELGGFGMECPQGLVLNVPKDAVEWKKDPVCFNTAKPRLAVVMDYLWYEGKNRAFSRERCLSGIHRADGTFFFRLSEEFKALFHNAQQHPFALINLIVVGTKDNAILPMYPNATESNPNTDLAFFGMRLGKKGGLKAFKEEVEANNPTRGTFLSISFTDVPGIVDAEHYDLESPWCFPVEIDGDYDHIFRVAKTIGGELPDLNDLYQLTWKNEYGQTKAK
jgi:hypothetical protein